MEGDILEVIGNMEPSERKEANRVLHEFELEARPFSRRFCNHARIRILCLVFRWRRRSALPVVSIAGIAKYAAIHTDEALP